jgi:hypothetical protein
LSHQSPATARTAPACGPHSVVLSLFTPTYWYRQGREPRFVIAAATPGPGPCLFNIGARYVAVVVNYGGERIWSSADCVAGVGSRTVELAPGRPAISWVNWNRKTSVPGCSAPRHKVRGATYTATAVSGHLRSQEMIFVLARKGVAVP